MEDRYPLLDEVSYLRNFLTDLNEVPFVSFALQSYISIWKWLKLDYNYAYDNFHIELDLRLDPIKLCVVESFFQIGLFLRKTLSNYKIHFRIRSILLR